MNSVNFRKIIRSSPTSFIICFLILISLLIYSPANANQITKATAFKKCGQEGTVKQRIMDCNTKCVHKNKNIWKLVTKTRFGYEVWYDTTTRQVWSETSSSMSDYIGAINVCTDRGRRDDFKGGIWGAWELANRWSYERSISAGISSCARNFADLYWTYYSQFDGVIYDGIIDEYYGADKRKYYKFRCVLNYSESLTSNKTSK